MSTGNDPGGGPHFTAGNRLRSGGTGRAARSTPRHHNGPPPGKRHQHRTGGRHWSIRGGGDRARGWLRSAMCSLAVLAAAAAAVSWDAQYVMVRQAKHTSAIAALEAAIPDVGALIFATLGIALALHGKRAIRARTLNATCVAVSLAMNALAAAPGWRDLAIWVMPSAIYALASDGDVARSGRNMSGRTWASSR